MTQSKIKRGVSLYSYAGEYGTTMNLEDCLADMHDMGATGLEILANGHIPNYPNPTPQWLEYWQRLLDKYHITPVEYGHWIDSRMIPGRQLTTQESYDSLVRDIKLASLLGFTVMRTKLGVIDFDLKPVSNWKEFIKMALPVAEEHGVVMCPEIHQPTALKSEMVDDYVDIIVKTGTKYFALNIDFGIFQTAERMEIPGHANQVVPVSDLSDYLAYTKVFHAKFTHMNDDMIDPTHPTGEIISLLKKHDWDGYLLSEYEGKNKDVVGYSSDQVRRHHVMMRSHIGESGAGKWDEDNPIPEASSLEPTLVQTRGFRNVVADGQIVGFQIPIRLKYYRGLWVSQVRAATVIVDDVEYSGDSICWTISQQKVEQSELASRSDLHWSSLDVAYLTIRKPGGLTPGKHHVKVAYDYSASYLPPAIDTGFFDSEGERELILVR